eukprot:1928640-Rhodomonas_salina.11
MIGLRTKPGAAVFVKGGHRCRKKRLKILHKVRSAAAGVGWVAPTMRATVAASAHGWLQARIRSMGYAASVYARSCKNPRSIAARCKCDQAIDFRCLRVSTHRKRNLGQRMARKRCGISRTQRSSVVFSQAAAASRIRKPRLGIAS